MADTAENEHGPTRADVRSAASKKAAATRRAQKAATTAQKRAGGTKPAGAKVKVKMKSSSWGVKAGAIRTVDAATADQLVADGHARRL